MGKSIDDLEDDDIPLSAFTGRAPKHEGKGGNRPDGPACPECPECPKGNDGYRPHTWKNATKKGHPYYRCSRCGGCWWPCDDNMQQIDQAKKWPPLDKEKQ